MDDDRGLDRLIRAAGDGFDPSPDLPERIGQRVRQRQARRRAVVSVGAVLLVAAIVGGGLKLAAQDGPGDEVRTASDDPTTTTVPGTAVLPPPERRSTTTGPPQTMVPAAGAPTIYALRGTPDAPQEPPVRLVEVDLATGRVLRDVIPLEDMTDAEPSGDEKWWVRREAQVCGNFTWEEFPAAGAGGVAVPPAVDVAKSPDGEFIASLRDDPLDCSAPRRLVVTDVSNSLEATLEVPPGSSQLAWRADSSGLAFSTEEPDALTADGSIESVSLSHGTVAGSVLASSPLVESDADCSVGNPAFGPDGRLWYTKACGTSSRIAATGATGAAPVDVEVSAGDPRWAHSLAVNRRTGQVAFVTGDAGTWILDDETPRRVADDPAQPSARTVGLLWPDR
jgi:hypothetical protein